MAWSVERYAVYWVDLDPVRGREIAKTRPALVISDDAMNRTLSTVVRLSHHLAPASSLAEPDSDHHRGT